MPLTFAPGSANGSQMCSPVAANTDDLVEHEEYFTIELALVPPAGSSLRLGTAETTLTLQDSDGN